VRSTFALLKCRSTTNNTNRWILDIHSYCPIPREGIHFLEDQLGAASIGSHVLDGMNVAASATYG